MKPEGEMGFCCKSFIVFYTIVKIVPLGIQRKSDPVLECHVL